MAEKEYGRRPVEDKNNSSILEQGRVSSGMVMSPRPSSMKNVGEESRQLSEVLESAGAAFESFARKKQDEGRVDGMLSRARGETELEIADKGEYAVEGYHAMDARINANTWYQEQLAHIAEDGRKTAPADYEKQLSQSFKTLSDSIGKDDYTRKYAASLAEQHYPLLMSQQVKSHNEWVKEENVRSKSGLVFSSLRTPNLNAPGDVSEAKELVDTNVTGLPDELDKKANTEGITAALNSDVPGMTSKLSQLGFLPKEMEFAGEKSSEYKNLLNAVETVESNNRDYNDAGTVVTSSKGAKYKMQVMPDTAKDPGYGIKPAANDSPEEYNRVGKEKLQMLYNRYGNSIVASMAYNAGEKVVDDYIKKVGTPGANISMEQFVANFPIEETRNHAIKIADKMKMNLESAAFDKGAAMQNFLSKGYTPEQATSIINEYSKYTERQQNKFNADRVMTEQSIINGARNDGNLPQALQQIQIQKLQNGYDDAWANKMTTSVVGAIRTYNKDGKKRQEINHAVATNTISVLSPKDQQTAIDTVKQNIIAEETAKGLGEDETGQNVMRRTISTLAENSVVDEKMAKGLSASLSGGILGKDGQVNDRALNAYQLYTTIENTTNPAYAHKYLTGDAKDLVMLAREFDSASGGEATVTALTAAQNHLTKIRETPDTQIPLPKDKEIDAAANEIIDKYDSGFWSGWTDKSTSNSDVLDSEIADGKNDPRLKAMLVQEFKTRYRNTGNTNVAMRDAQANVASRIEFALGNVLVGSRSSTIRQDMGLPMTGDTLVANAITEYVRNNGKDMFGEKRWEDAKTQWLPRGDKENLLGGKAKIDPKSLAQGAVDRLSYAVVPGSPMLSDTGVETREYNRRDVPGMFLEYNPDTKLVRFALYANHEKTKLYGEEVYIPIDDIGRWASTNLDLNKVENSIASSDLLPPIESVFPTKK